LKRKKLIFISIFLKSLSQFSLIKSMQKPIYKTAEEALASIQSRSRVFVHGSAHTPIYLLNKLAAEHHRLEKVEIVCITILGDFDILKPEFRHAFRINSMFSSAPLREAIKEGYADYIPVFLSEIPEFFKRGIMKLDFAIVQVSPPDAHGYCSLGVSVDVARSAVNNCAHIIAQVNPQIPRTHGDGMIHFTRFKSMVWKDEPIFELNSGKPSEVEMEIGKNIAGLVEDRSTLQTGIGAIPNAALMCMGNHKDLGIHTEMFSDGVLELVKNDVINNRFKPIHPNKSVSGFALGTRNLYDFVHDNPAFAFLDIDYVNDPHVIRKIPKMVAINSAIEIDLTGQVCSDSIGTYQFSGVGGQMDFLRGAALSDGGKPIVAIPSQTNKGESKIVPFLKPGAGVVTTRAHVHYVVTEYGVAYLYGKNLRQRAKALIEISHPNHRENLDKAFFERFKKEWD
jgi:acyl-CoA hydrolase